MTEDILVTLIQTVHEWAALNPFYGYVGLFLVGFVSALSFLLPTPAFLLAFTLGAVLNPFLVGLSFGLGSGIGEMPSYLLGVGGERLFLKKHHHQLKEVEKKFQKYGGFVVLYAFAALPLPIDVAAIFAGAIGYPWKNALLAIMAGKVTKFVFIAYAGLYGLNWVREYFSFG